MHAESAIDAVREAKARTGAVVWRARAQQDTPDLAIVFADVQHVGPDLLGDEGEPLVSAGDAWREVWYVGDNPLHTQRVI